MDLDFPMNQGRGFVIPIRVYFWLFFAPVSEKDANTRINNLSLIPHQL